MTTESMKNKVDTAPETKEEEAVLTETKKQADALKEDVEKRMDDIASKYTLLIWKEHKEKNGSEPSLSDIAKGFKGKLFENIDIGFVDKIVVTWEKFTKPFKDVFDKIGGLFGGGEKSEGNIIELSTSQRIFKQGLLTMLGNPMLAPKILDQLNIVGEIRNDLKSFSQELSSNMDITKLDNKSLELDNKLLVTDDTVDQEIEEDNNYVATAATVGSGVALASTLEEETDLENDKSEDITDAVDEIIKSKAKGEHCWEWADMVYKKAGLNNGDRKILYQEDTYPKTINELGIDKAASKDKVSEQLFGKLNIGDWLYIHNGNSEDKRGDHSVLFLGRENQEEGIAKVGMGPGANKPGKYSEYNLYKNPITHVTRYEKAA